MLEEASEETLALIKKLDGIMNYDEDVDKFKTTLSSIAPKVVRYIVIVIVKLISAISFLVKLISAISLTLVLHLPPGGPNKLRRKLQWKPASPRH